VATVTDELITEADALRRFPDLQKLVDIRQAGWQFLQLSVDGEPALVGRYNWSFHIDALWIFDRNRCVAIRMIDDQPGATGGTVWQYEGSLIDAVDELLTLPEPSNASAPQLIKPSSTSLLWHP
jgi:hypothetical protein